MERIGENGLETPDLQALVELLGSQDFALSQAAAHALMKQGGPALDALVEGLSHSNWRARKNSAGLMDHLGEDRCIEPLRHALNDPIADVRRLAVHAIGCQACKRTPLQADIVSLLIERALSDVSLRVRRAAVHMLGLQPYDARAVEALAVIVAQETDSGVLSRAQFALAAQRRKAMEATAHVCPGGDFGKEGLGGTDDEQEGFTTDRG